MTTFTTEDREESARLFTKKIYFSNTQEEIKFFWPLTEQMELDLEYGPTHLFYRAKGIAGVHSMPIIGTIHEFTDVGTTTLTTTILADAIKTDGITFTSKDNPPLYRRILYKLLGINWEQK